MSLCQEVVFLDRNGKVLVDNASKMAITYTRGRKTTQSEMLDTAEKLSKLIKMDTKKITERDKKRFLDSVAS